jgi:hypothetical protein
MRAAGDSTDEAVQVSTGASLALMGTTVFLSALLRFQVQPIIGKFILPWFGSTPGVWATTLLFFQVMLVGGYAYAHFVVSRMGWRRQAILHAVLLGVVLIALPITPAEALKPTSADAPAARILLILAVSVGAPYLLLSATAPLIQRWFAHLHPGRSPYRLYALSNVGSLLALLSYPFLVEPYVRLQSQTSYWSLAYVVFAALCAACAWAVYRSVPDADFRSANEDAERAAGGKVPDARPGVGAAVLWLLLSACGSGLLLATTNQMSMDIAVVPFLWVLPLCVYLLTFILTFDHERWYARPLFIAALPLALINAVRLLYGGVDLGLVDQVVGYSLTLFVCCMCCHGELSRARPAAHHLTFFFLMVSIGGAVGGVLVAIVAPFLFPGTYEYHVLLVGCYLLIGFVLGRLLMSGDLVPAAGPIRRALTGMCLVTGLTAIAVGTLVLLRPETWTEGASTDAMEAFGAWQVQMRLYGIVMTAVSFAVIEQWRRVEGVALRPWWTSRHGLARVVLTGATAVGLVSLAGGLAWQVINDERRTVELDRNFYGALAIKERDAGDWMHRLSLTHGRIRHGSQLQLYPSWPTEYYGPETGVGLALQHHPNRSDATRQFRVGVVGLGVGTIAAYANARVDAELEEESYVSIREAGEPDYLRFYELNPLVTRWATDRFTFLGDARARGADVAVFEGDARITLERQLEQGDAQRFDVFAVDAFSSDAIPLHLLTLESVQTYLAHLTEDGILALHVTNRFVDLLPIVQRLADAADLSAIYVENYSSSSRLVNSSDWVLLTRNQSFLNLEIVREDEEPMPEPGPLWTDDFSSLWEVVELDN